jgi:hypothetical protein
LNTSPNSRFPFLLSPLILSSLTHEEKRISPAIGRDGRRRLRHGIAALWPASSTSLYLLAGPRTEAADICAVPTFRFHYAVRVILFAFFRAYLVTADVANLQFVLAATVPFVILPVVFLLRDDFEPAFGNNDSGGGARRIRRRRTGDGEEGR